MTGDGSLLQRLHEVYAALPGQERRAADLILDQPQEMAVWTAVELAARAGVSNATVSRLMQRLGYPNFEAARQEARKLRETGSPLFLRKTPGGPIGALIAAEAGLIEAALSAVDAQMVEDIAGALATAPRVWAMGYRNSRFLADYLLAQLAQLRPGVSRLGQEGQTAAEGIAALGAQDVVVILGLRRRPAGFAAQVQAIAERGARIVLLADRSLRVVPALARWPVTCPVETGSSQDSYTGVMALLRLLVMRCAEALGEAGQQHLQAVEALRERLGELEPPLRRAQPEGDNQHADEKNRF